MRGRPVMGSTRLPTIYGASTVKHQGNASGVLHPVYFTFTLLDAIDLAHHGFCGADERSETASKTVLPHYAEGIEGVVPVGIPAGVREQFDGLLTRDGHRERRAEAHALLGVVV